MSLTDEVQLILFVRQHNESVEKEEIQVCNGIESFFHTSIIELPFGFVGYKVKNTWNFGVVIFRDNFVVSFFFYKLGVNGYARLTN